MLQREKRPDFVTTESTKHTFYKAVTEHLKMVAARKIEAVPGVMLQDVYLNFTTGRAEQPKAKHCCKTFVNNPLNPDQPMSYYKVIWEMP